MPDSNKKEYTLILLATPIQDIEERKLKLGEFYSGLAPYASWQTDFHLQENKSLGSTATVGVNIGASAGVQNGTNSAITENASEDRESVVNGYEKPEPARNTWKFCDGFIEQFSYGWN